MLTSKNEFGKLQSDIDVKADEIIFKHLKDSGVVYAGISEETPKVSSAFETHQFGCSKK